MMDKEKSLAGYRFAEAKETLASAKLCLENKLYKDAINRAYYVVFYAIKSILALEQVDFKRHKDAVGYFNKHYVATEIFSKELGKKIGRLKRKREASDYDDFYVAAPDEAKDQVEVAREVLDQVGEYLKEKNIIEQ